MKQKELDIVAILKTAKIQSGATLYSPVCGNCTFLRIMEHDYSPIRVETADGMEIGFARDGRYFDDGETVLYPSKDNHDWSKVKPKYDFKTFDRVLCRDSENCEWIPGVFVRESYKKDGMVLVHTLESATYLVSNCIPYEGHEHLAYTKKSELE